MQTVEPNNIDLGSLGGAFSGGTALGALVGSWLTKIYMRGYAQGRQDNVVAQHGETLKKIETDLQDLRGRHESLKSTLMNWTK
ncbi:MAG: hypothetical protein OEZ59_04030 [Deltaproteobacteria bacterium]|nr:hypothetical protein [Deltaproteobacteria bacterium]